MTRISFKVEGVPKGYDRDAAHHGFTPKDVERWRRWVQLTYQAEAARLGVQGMHLGLVKLAVEAAGTRADADNLVKEIMDALKGYAYKDDAQVWALLVKLPYRRLGPGGGVCAPKEDPWAVVEVELQEGRHVPS